MSENSHQDPHSQGEATGDGPEGKALESLFAEGETAEDFVARVNEGAGTKYDSFDALVKGVGESGKLAAELGRLKKEKGVTDTGDGNGSQQQQPPAQQQQTPSDDVVEVFFDGNEDAARVRGDLERVAKAQGRSVIAVWKDKDNEGWLHEKSEALKSKAEARDRVGDPSGQLGRQAPTEEQKIAKKLSGNLPPGFSAEPPKEL